jgi:hypothetical protein
MPTDQCSTLEGAKTVIRNFVSTMDGYAQTYVDISNNVNIGAGNISPNTQLNALFKTLTYQKKQLAAQIKQLKSSIERHNRNFLDLEDVATPNTGSIHTLDDYTLWTLVLSYVFFAIAVVFCYSHLNNYTPKAIAISVGGMALISMFLFVLAIIIL